MLQVASELDSDLVGGMAVQIANSGNSSPASRSTGAQQQIAISKGKDEVLEAKVDELRRGMAAQAAEMSCLAAKLDAVVELLHSQQLCNSQDAVPIEEAAGTTVPRMLSMTKSYDAGPLSEAGRQELLSEQRRKEREYASAREVAVPSSSDDGASCHILIVVNRSLCNFIG